jgi:hypothetical protein
MSSMMAHLLSGWHDETSAALEFDGEDPTLPPSRLVDCGRISTQNLFMLNLVPHNFYVSFSFFTIPPRNRKQDVL